jgi:hypothetical protein
MRTIPAAMQAIIDAGPPFTADNRPQTRITALQNWQLTPSSGPVGNRATDKLPIRYYQDDEYSSFSDQVEIPGVKQVVIDRQLLNGAATIQVEIYNTVTPSNGAAGPNPDVFGDPGHYSYQPNQWQNFLRENVMLNVWQGFGGEDLSIGDAIAAGNLILDGVFLVDTVAIEAQTGLITLTGRDMGKLLVDQVAWPPTVPQAFYGASGPNGGIIYYVTGQDGDSKPQVPGYDSEVFTPVVGVAVVDADGNPNANVDASISTFSGGQSDGSSDDLVTAQSEQGAYLLTIEGDNGPASALANAYDVFWLSPGYGSPTDTTYIEVGVGASINGVLVNPWVAGLQCYVSVMQNNEWVSGIGTVDGVPYVSLFGLPTSGQDIWVPLPATYVANAVRFTFSNLQPPPSGEGTSGQFYAAIEDLNAGFTPGIPPNVKVVLDFSPTPSGQGYTLFGSDGGVFNYGDSNFFGSLAGQALNGLIIGGENTATNLGYWMCGSDGGVFTFGDAMYYGGEGGTTISAPIVAFRGVPGSSSGYYMLGADGAVYTFGGAVYHGRQTGVNNMVDITILPNNSGYWLLDADGNVYSFGAAVYHGGHGAPSVAIDSSGTGGGYRIATATGGVYCFGDAVSYPSDTGAALGTLAAPISAIRRTPDDLGYWLVGEDGGVFCFTESGTGTATGGGPGNSNNSSAGASFFGSLPGATIMTGNYKDLSDIVTDFLLWAGFWLYPKSTDGVVDSGKPPNVFGNIETTGAWNSVGPIPADTWDKLQLIDCINSVSAIVGYILRVDEIGAARWSSPNFWSAGNFLDDGTYTTQMPVLDERTNLNDYTQTTTDQTTVSEIIVSPVDPYLFGGDPADTTVTRFIPAGISNLHGIQKPAMLGTVLNVPISLTDQEVMAELLAIQCYFASRQGQAVAFHNPAICVDDQIQISERSTGEDNVHYVTGVHVEHDLDTGQKLATYSTYWLGNSKSWAINTNADSILAGSTDTDTTYDNNGIVISQQLINFLANTGAKSVSQLIPGATAPLLASPNGPETTSSDVIDPSGLASEGISPS